THIIHQRMDEIFDKVVREVQQAGYQGKLNAGIVLTGGGSSLEGITELAADVFGLGVRVGMPGPSWTASWSMWPTPAFPP
ncbi:MAG: hypothetical protein ACK5WJ_14820, partial [Gemmatimonas sp.]